MIELFDLETDPGEQQNVADSHPDTVIELERRLDAWLTHRLEETGREVDPVAAQGTCATQIGEPIPDEVVGAGATPLHERVGATAAAIPDPNALNSGTC